MVNYFMVGCQLKNDLDKDKNIIKGELGIFHYN